MKNVSIKILVALVLSLGFFTGCGVKKMIKKYDAEVKYEVTPEILETKGGQVEVKVVGTFPEKYFYKKGVVEFTPVVKWNGGEYKLNTITMVGEKADAQGEVISKEGGSFTFTQTFPYDPAMNISELVVSPMVYKSGKPDKSKDLGETKLADAMIYTSERVGQDEVLQLAAHGYEKETIITEKANLYFAYNSSNLNSRAGLNAEDANEEAISLLKEFVQQGWVIKSIDINGWASPEGELTLNKDLSGERAEAVQNYLFQYFKSLKWKKDCKVQIENCKDDINWNLVANGEDFDGFMTALQASNIPTKNQIANVIKSQNTKADREQEIKNMTVVWSEIEDMLEVLRRSEISVNCFEPKRTDANILELAKNMPNKDSLKNEEMLYAATLINDAAVKMAIYKATMIAYPNDWRAYNNVAYLYLKDGDQEEAQSLLEKANTLKPNNGQVISNLGVCASWNADFSGAKSFYQQAAQNGVNTDYNQGILMIREGNYSGAVSNMSGCKNKYNIALANLMNGDNAACISTLEGLSPKTAEGYYLAAVAGARATNKNVVITNLKASLKADPKLRTEAANDREFMKYYEDADFKALVK